MPTLGGTIQAWNQGNYGSSFFGSSVFVPDNPAIVPTIYVTPIVPDETFFPDQTAAAGSTLRDFTEGQDWFLKRLVGKLAVSIEQSSPGEGGSTYPTIMFGAAFFVARADDNNPNFPDLQGQEYDPLGSQNIRQPWIWRRTWILSNQAAPVPGSGLPPWPTNNEVFGSALDGPHIDAKTARRIRREERLWFCANAYGGVQFPGDENIGVSFGGKAYFTLDYRVLGAMRRSNNRSTF